MKKVFIAATKQNDGSLTVILFCSGDKDLLHYLGILKILFYLLF